MAGTKQLEEIITGVAAGAEAALKKLSDGFQLSDVQEILADQELAQKVKLGIEGAGEAVAEAQDLSFLEMISLARHAYEEIQKVIAALPKKEA